MNDFDRERTRSLKFVQVVFALLAVVSVGAGLAVAYAADDFGLPDSSSETIAFAFLAVGVMNTALLFLWERVFDKAT